MKNIDVKSLIIGALFTSTVLLGMGAVSIPAGAAGGLPDGRNHGTGIPGGILPGVGIPGVGGLPGGAKATLPALAVPVDPITGLPLPDIGATKPASTKETSGRFELMQIGFDGEGIPHFFCFDTVDGVLYGGNDTKWGEAFGWKD